VAECFELSGEAADLVVVAVEAVVVVEAELVVGLVAGEDVVGADEDRVRDGNDRLVVAAAASEAEAVRFEVAVATVGGGACALDQDLARPGVAAAGAAGAAFAA
jgi:hypothetical protein